MAATFGNLKWQTFGLKVSYALIILPVIFDALTTTILVIPSSPNFMIKIPEALLAIVIPLIHFFTPYGELGTYNDIVFGFLTSLIFYGLVTIQILWKREPELNATTGSITSDNLKGTVNMSISDATWKVRIPGQPEEPVNTITLQNWVKSGFVKADTMVMEVSTGYTYQAKQIPGIFSTKSYVTTLLLSFFFGVFGVDRFYLGHIGVGLGKLFTFGGLGIWALIDFILIATKNVKDSFGIPLA